jgi:uncharacterized protein
MGNEQQLIAIRNYVYHLFHEDVTGHDYFHMKRVANLAKQIGKRENGDVFICEVAAWIHDVGDHKLFINPDVVWDDLLIFLQSISITDKQIHQISAAVKDVSFSKGQTIPLTLEGKIVQDADRIDAIGAIGIARTFAYGGANKQFIHHPTHQQTSIQHFDDKLLKLKDLMHTATAIGIAEKRHRFMEQFLFQFMQEW